MFAPVVVENLELTQQVRPQSNSPDEKASRPLPPLRGARKAVSIGRLASRASAKMPPSSLLVSSLRRLDQSKGCPKVGNGCESPAQATGDSMAGMLESVFDVGELDPFPFVNQRYEQAEFERERLRSGAANSDSPRPSCAGAAQQDRRSFPRRESACNVDIRQFSGEERLTRDRMNWLLHAAQLQGQLVDVSMGGAALSVPEQLAPGTRVVLRITNRIADRHVDTVARVLRCRPDAEAAWSVVCRFEKNLTFEQIHLIGLNLFAATIV